ncbi:MAG: tetratricopeptide repeat protein [candidate division Zixibacteria bacterium]|nr:tetratricopeptide repeat protein [candidate division Zixibacteria bacterium]
MTPRRPHNDFLWVLSETGIIGCLLFIAIFSICFYYLFKSIKRADTKDRMFLLMLFFGLTGFVGISFFSFPKERIEAQLFIHIIFGLILLKYNSFYPKIPFQKKHAILYILVPLLALSVVSTAMGYIKLTSNMAAMKTKMLNNHRQYRAALNEIDKADMVLSPVDDKGFPLHAIRAFSYQGIENWEFAIRDNKLALQSCPYNAVILNNLALSYKKNEDLENAELVYNECRELNPEYTTALVNLAILYAQTDRIDKAYELLKEHNPETPKSAKYEDVLLRILRFKTYQIIETIDEELILKVLKIKVEKDKWLNKVHKKSIKNDLPLEKQILKKAIYILEKVDSTINKSQANILREKYNIHKGGKQ